MHLTLIDYQLGRRFTHNGVSLAPGSMQRSFLGGNFGVFIGVGMVFCGWLFTCIYKPRANATMDYVANFVRLVHAFNKKSFQKHNAEESKHRLEHQF